MSDLVLTVATLPLVWGAFVIPGFLVLRPWSTAERAVYLSFPATLVLLHTLVLAAQLMGMPIRGLTMFVGIIAAVLVSRLLGRRRGGETTSLGEVGDLAGQGVRAALRSWPTTVAVLVLMSVVSLTFGRAPLAFSDNTFRWRNLAEQMYAFRSLSFYPPRSPGDFASYFMADGIPPLLSVSYWWCYVLLRSSSPLHVLGFIQLEALWIVVATVAVALHLRRESRSFAILLACLASIPWNAAAAGSESALLALGTLIAVSAVLSLDASEGDEGSVALVLGVAISALAREYGLANAVVAAAVLIARRKSWGRSWWYPMGHVGAFFLLGGLWYVRTWVRSGNPLYMMELGGLFPGLKVYSYYLRYTHSVQGFAHLSARQIGVTIVALLAGAPLAWFLGAPALLAAVFRSPASASNREQWRSSVMVALFIITWLAVYYTATNYSAGGPMFAIRVASPVVALLTAVAAGFGVPVRIAPVWRALAVLLFAKTGLDLFLGNSVGFLFGPRRWAFPVVHELSPLPEPVAERLRRGGGKILGANGHFEPAMRASGVHLLPVWSPEFAFVLDEALGPDMIAARLRDLKIVAYDPVRWEEFASPERARVLNAAFADWRPLLLEQEPHLRVPPWSP